MLLKQFVFCRCNFSDTEIEMFFSRYDIDGNVLLDRHETNKAREDFDKEKKKDFPKARPGKQTSRA